MKPAAPAVRLADLPSYHGWLWRADDAALAELRGSALEALARADQDRGLVRVSEVIDPAGQRRLRVERRRTRRA